MASELDVDDVADPTVVAVERIQNIDAQGLARTEALGQSLDFSDAVPAFRRTVEFFRQIPLTELSDLPEQQRNNIQRIADEVFQIYRNMMSFNPASVSNAAADREAFINAAKGTFFTSFEQLHPLVSYLNSRHRDLNSVEREAKTTISVALDEVELAKESLKESSEDAKRILSEIRSTAAEGGVSQKATYFGDQATSAAAEALTWQKRTYLTAAGLGTFALATWALGFWIEPKTTYQAIQFAISKVLIFSTIAFLLFLSARTLMAHRHNEVVNRHRQNALLTFNALVDAATTDQTREVVLTHASACIYAPQESGFTKPGSIQTPSSLIELAPRIIGAAQHGA